MKVVFSLMLTIVTATALCTSAAASDTGAARQRVVSYADLNLNNAAGVQALYRRLTQAVRAVCQPMPSAPYLRRIESRRCARTALRDAVAAVNNANLIAYYNERTSGDKEAEKLALRR